MSEVTCGLCYHTFEENEAETLIIQNQYYLVCFQCKEEYERKNGYE